MGEQTNDSEHEEPDFEYASLSERIGATLIDYVALIVAIFPGLILPDTIGGIWILLWMIFVFAHFFVLEGVWRNQTVGKYFLGVKVVKDSGASAGLWNCFVRNIIGLLGTGWLGWLVGVFAIHQSEENKRLGDSLAGTIVIKTPIESLD